MAKAGCPYASKCGGCDYQGIDYIEQLRIKQDHIDGLLGSFCKPQKIIGMKDPLYYRCKATVEYTHLKDGSFISGVYEKNSHRIVKVDECLITDKHANDIAMTIRALLKSFKIKTYNEDTGYGLLRHVQIRVGKNTGEVMVILVVADPIFPSKNNFVKALRARHPEITTVVLNVNDKHTTMVLGERNIPIYGKGFILDTLLGMKFKISPGSFYQVNPVQTEVLYKTAVDYAGLTGNETVLDAYSGTGTIGLIAAGSARDVISVELNDNAVKDAIANAKANGVGNIRFYRADATEFMTSHEIGKVDVVFMDPPRTGSTPEFIDAVAKLKPSKVIYVSCDPETLKRDLGIFAKKGYKTRRIQPVDMFGFTKHVEVCCLLEQLKSTNSPEKEVYYESGNGQGFQRKCIYRSQ